MNSLELEFWVLLCLHYIFEVMLHLTNAISAFWDWSSVKQDDSKNPLTPLWFLPTFTLVLLHQVSHQQVSHHQVRRCDLSVQPNVPLYACTSCSWAVWAAPSSHMELPRSPAASWAGIANGWGQKAKKGCRWGSCCPISWWLQPPVARFDIKKCQVPVVDVSICHCSTNWDSLGCTRLARTRQATKSLAFPFQSFTSAGILKTCRGSRCCGARICLLQLAVDILWCFTSVFPSAAEPGGVVGVPEILAFAAGTRTHKGHPQKPEWVPTQ